MREISALANDIANKWQLGNLCFKNAKKLSSNLGQKVKMENLKSIIRSKRSKFRVRVRVGVNIPLAFSLVVL